MNPRLGTTRVGAPAGIRRYAWRFVGLWAIWLLLWGKLTVLAIASGALVAVAVVAAFPFHAIDPERRVRPLATLKLLGFLLVDLVPSALGVAWQVIRFGPRTPAAVVAVPLLSDSQVVATLAANAVSLSPGAFVLEIDHDARVCYVYALPVPSEHAVETTRLSVTEIERRVVEAFGSDESVAGLAERLADRFTEHVTGPFAERTEHDSHSGENSGPRGRKDTDA